MVSKSQAFGSRLRARRELAGLTLQQLADRAGLTKMGLAKIEWGDRHPRLDTLVKLANAFGCSLDDLARPAPGSA